MSKISEIHNEVLALMMDDIDGYLEGGSLRRRVKKLKDTKGVALEAIDEVMIESFATKMLAETTVTKGRGKKLKKYELTVSELKEAEAKFEEAKKRRDQLLDNKLALIASLSEKALQVVQIAHVEIGAELKEKKRKELVGSEPSSRAVSGEVVIAESTGIGGYLGGIISAVGGGSATSKKSKTTDA
jgi:hypothetical protein